MVKPAQFSTLLEFLTNFKDEEKCRQYFEQIRFKDGDYCPHCAHGKINRFADGKRYRCAKCRKDFTIKTGTVFGESKISLQKWFIAIYLLTTSPKGISSVQLAKQLGVTQKTAWFMDHRIRKAMKNGGKLFGNVEVDETYIGGKEKNKHASKRTKGVQGRSLKTKNAVMGMVVRNGNVIASVIPNAKMRTLESKIVAHIDIGSTLYTDELMSYSKIGSLYKHEAVNHSSGEYVRGDAHTNNVESFWALFKRGYHGTYHTMSGKHLQRYVDEFAFRWNERNTPMDSIFANTVESVAETKTLHYKKLTATV
ncbi:MAG: IS1595 family transposase [bacterium]|nr:IS1595 family transposase [bacterium]